MNSESQKLLEYIQEKEQAEKRKKRVKAFVGTTVALMLGAGVVIGLPQLSLPEASSTQYQSAQLPTIPAMALSQEDGGLYPSEIGENGPFVEVDILPHYPGGELALYRFLSKQIRYPVEAARRRIEGKVLVRFVIDETGSVSQAEVVKGIGFGCDEEALRIINKMPKWIPGQLKDQNVPVYSSLAVNFKFL